MTYPAFSSSAFLRNVFIALTFFFISDVTAQISITTLPYASGVTDFNNYNPNSAANLTATIPAGWTASSSGAAAYNGQGTGASNVGGYWAYGSASEYSLGALRSGTPGNITYTVTYINNTGTTINGITLEWDYEQWRYANTSGWNVSGTGALAGNATLNALDFAGVAAGTNGTVSVTEIGPVTLSGLSIANGASFGISWITTDITGSDNGVSIDNFSIAMCATPSVTLGQNPIVCLNTTQGSISYTLTGIADQYSIDYSASANTAGFTDVVNATLPASEIPIAIPAGVAAGQYTGVLTVRSSTGGCVSSNQNITISVISCDAPFMSWIALGAGDVVGSCVSATDCDINRICYGLQYTPAASGILTSYTTAFFIDCSSLGNPVFSNTSCVMVNNSSVMADCAGLGLVRIASSGNTGSLPLVANTPVILHQICIDIPPTETLLASEDEATNLSTSINATGGGAVTEFPGFIPTEFNSDIECLPLPVRWLAFTAKPMDNKHSQLEWTTTGEINNSHFEIERSNDKGLSFQKIGMVTASSIGNAVNTYQFIDRTAYSGINYYRLKQMDYDGEYAYSAVRSVSITSGNFLVNAHPVPASGHLNIKIEHALSDGQLTLVDLAGAVVLRRIFKAGTSTQVLDLHDIQPGLYSLISLSGESHRVQKIVIVE